MILEKSLTHNKMNTKVFKIKFSEKIGKLKRKNQVNYD